MAPVSDPSTPSRGGFSSSYVKLLVDHVRLQGHDVAPVLQALQLPEAALADPVMRVTARRLTEGLHAAGRLCRDPHIGLTVGQQVKPAAMGPLGYALTSCSDLVDGLALFERLQALVCSEIQAEHRVVGDVLESRHQLLGDVPRDTQLWTFLVVSRIAFARWVASRHLVPYEIHLPCPAPADPRPLQAFMGCPLHFDAPEAREKGPADWLRMDNPHADPQIHSVMSAMTDHQWQQSLQAGDPLLGPLHQLIAHQLQRGQLPTLESLAEGLDSLLGMSPRQLQRRLADQGLSFKDEVEAVRRQQVLHELRHTNLPLVEVATRAAYAEPSSMHRAVRRWTGQTPAEVRQGQAPT
jgi:AraC-like DNA-binding protein